MPKPSSSPSDAQQRQRALAHWENEGGAGLHGPLEAIHMLASRNSLPKIGEAEMLSLHVRVVALENLLIALLSTASEKQLEIARDMAAYITPRPEATPHPLTTLASAHMTDLIERAVRLHPVRTERC